MTSSGHRGVSVTLTISTETPYLTRFLRRPTSAPLLVVEAFAVTVAIIAAVWLGWVVLWLLEQRW